MASHVPTSLRHPRRARETWICFVASALAMLGCRDVQRGPSLEQGITTPARPDLAPSASPSTSLPHAGKPAAVGGSATDGAAGDARGLASASPDRDLSPWESPATCARALAAGGRLAREPGRARIASWNIRWFPDGRPGKTAPDHGATDVAWLACAIAWLDADVVAVQEIKRHTRAKEELAELTAALDGHTGGAWRVELDRCPADPIQHVGFLYDAKRVRVAALRNVGAVNPYGEACKNSLRPGFAGYFTFPGGLDVHVVSVHLKSGPKRKSFDLRQKSLAALPAVFADAQAAATDADVVIAGDFNTMGCRKCATPTKAAGERKLFADTLGRSNPAFRLVPAGAGCSEYYGGRGGLLDHFAVTESTAEAPSDVTTRVSGYCGEAACAALSSRRMPAAYERLSDHCPIILDLRDVDTD